MIRRQVASPRILGVGPAVEVPQQIVGSPCTARSSTSWWDLPLSDLTNDGLRSS